MKLHAQYAAFLILCSLFVAGCAIKPQNELEGVGFVQEKLDTALTVIEVAYNTGAITQAKKNDLLKDWQKAKDAEAAALAAFAEGGPASMDNATDLARSLLRQLVRLGLLTEEDNE